MNVERSTGLGRRAAAKLTDAVLITWLACAVANVFLILMMGPDAWDPAQNSATTAGLAFDFLLVLVGPMLFLILQLIFLRLRGATIGKMIFDLEVVRVDGRRPGLGACLGRTLAEYLSALVIGLGYVSAFTNRERSTWHDRVSRTVVRSVASAAETGPRTLPRRRMVGAALASVIVATSMLLGVMAPQFYAWSRSPLDRHIWAGIRASAHGDDRAAIEAFNRAIQLDPRSSLAYANRGSAYGNLGDRSRQIQDYSRALELDSTQVWALLGLANAYQSQDSLGLSSRMYSRVIDLRPDWGGLVFAYRGRGSNRFRGGDYELAAADFRKGFEVAMANYLGTSDFRKDRDFMAAIDMCEDFHAEALRRMGRDAQADSLFAVSQVKSAISDDSRQEWRREWLGYGEEDARIPALSTAAP